MSELARYFEAFRASNGNDMYKAIRIIDQHMDLMIARTGKQPLSFLDAPTPDVQSSLRSISSVVPPPASFSVTGIDGKFIIAIQNPDNVLPLSPAIQRAQARIAQNPHHLGIVHNLESATDSNFNNSSAVIDYGISAQLVYTEQNPNATLFWRLRSSYDGKTWNAWQIYSSALTCGPIGVQSGFLRSTAAAPNAQLNSSNNATADSIDAGASATIRVYGLGGVGSSWTRFDGQGGQTTLPAGTITGQPYNSDVLVVYSAANGFQVFLKNSQYPSALVDAALFAGVLHTVAAGGGGGVPGGGGGSSGGGGGGRLA